MLDLIYKERVEPNPLFTVGYISTVLKRFLAHGTGLEL